MKHTLSSSEASIILETLKKVLKAANKSPVMAAALDIDKHDLQKCKAVVNNLGK